MTSCATWFLTLALLEEPCYASITVRHKDYFQVNGDESFNPQGSMSLMRISAKLAPMRAGVGVPTACWRTSSQRIATVAYGPCRLIVVRLPCISSLITHLNTDYSHRYLP